MADDMVDFILQFRPAQLELFNFLIGCEINVLLDAIDRVVETMIFVEHFPEMCVGALEAPDDFAMFGKLPQDRVM